MDSHRLPGLRPSGLWMPPGTRPPVAAPAPATPVEAPATAIPEATPVEPPAGDPVAPVPDPAPPDATPAPHEDATRSADEQVVELLDGLVLPRASLERLRRRTWMLIVCATAFLLNGHTPLTIDVATRLDPPETIAPDLRALARARLESAARARRLAQLERFARARTRTHDLWRTGRVAMPADLRLERLALDAATRVKLEGQLARPAAVRAYADTLRALVPGARVTVTTGTPDFTIQLDPDPAG
jgi:hypothetical protein